MHSDLLGPIEVPSTGGSRYVITFIDGYSRWTVAYPIHNKSKDFECFKKFKAMAEKHTSRKISTLNVYQNTSKDPDTSNSRKLKALRSDPGGEYLSNEFKRFLRDHGIKQELTIPHTPQQNGIAERMNRTLLDLTRAMLHHKNVDKSYWAEAISTAVYTRNRVTSRSLPANLTPYHFWFGRAPDLSHMRIFGGHCWYTIPRKKVKKLDSRANPGLMMGYSQLL